MFLMFSSSLARILIRLPGSFSSLGQPQSGAVACSDCVQQLLHSSLQSCFIATRFSGRDMHWTVQLLFAVQVDMKELQGRFLKEIQVYMKANMDGLKKRVRVKGKGKGKV